MIKIVNKHYTNEGEYIGRGSPLGNPYSHITGTKAQFLVRTRQEAVDCYRDWLNEQIKNGNQRVINELIRLLNIYLKTGELTLRCFCAPKACHGDVLKEFFKNWVKTHKG